MSDQVFTLTIPAALARELEWANQELLLEVLERGLREWKIERALERYGRGDVSFGAAANLAGVSQTELARHAYARGMEPAFSTETLAEELD